MATRKMLWFSKELFDKDSTIRMKFFMTFIDTMRTLSVYPVSTATSHSHHSSRLCTGRST